MSRYYWDKKNTTEDCTQLSIFKLKEFGLLRGFCGSTLTWTRKSSGQQSSIGIIVNINDEPYAKVNYTITDRHTGKKTDYDYKIGLTTTPCHFGAGGTGLSVPIAGDGWANYIWRVGMGGFCVEPVKSCAIKAKMNHGWDGPAAYTILWYWTERLRSFQRRSNAGPGGAGRRERSADSNSLSKKPAMPAIFRNGDLLF